MSHGNIAFVAYHDAPGFGQRDIFVIDSGGSYTVNLTNNEADDVDPAWSPDGTRIAFVSDRDGAGGHDAGNWEIYIMNADGSDVVRLTTNSTFDSDPAWSPDGTQIAFVSGRDDDFVAIYIMDADGSNVVQLVGQSTRIIGASNPAWSPDGSRIAFVAYSPTAPYTDEIYAVDANGANVVRVTRNRPDDDDPVWSADGTRIAFSRRTDKSWFTEIYVIKADGSHAVRLTAADGGAHPAWSPDGTRIAFVRDRPYLNDDIYIMDADGSNVVQLTDTMSVDGPLSWCCTSPAP